MCSEGRLGEIFFVDLPDLQTRAEIFNIHLAKRNQQIDEFDVPLLSEIADGFSGAEIEQAIVSSLYTVSALEQSLTQDQLEQTIRNTSPLSVVMHEKVEGLRHWAKDRCVFAD